MYTYKKECSFLWLFLALKKSLFFLFVLLISHILRDLYVSLFLCLLRRKITRNSNCSFHAKDLLLKFGDFDFLFLNFLKSSHSVLLIK